MSDTPHPVCLIVFKSDGGQRVLALKPGNYVIGRHESVALRIPMPSVSRRHCELTCGEGTLSVTDLGSANGTFRNAQQLSARAPTELEAGDTLAIGPVQMVVQLNGQPEHIEAPAGGFDEMAETPPSGSPAIDENAPGSEVDADLDETIAKPAAGMGSLLSGDPEDSSIFDFDFDFEDDDSPKL